MRTESDRSLEAYIYVRDSGKVTGLHSMIYRILYHQGPMTSEGIWQQVLALRPNTTSHSVTPRTKEMKERKMIWASGETQCPNTGRMVTLWDVTTAMPEPKPLKPETKMKRIERVLRETIPLMNPDTPLFNEEGWTTLRDFYQREFSGTW